MALGKSLFFSFCLDERRFPRVPHRAHFLQQIVFHLSFYFLVWFYFFEWETSFMQWKCPNLMALVHELLHLVLLGTYLYNLLGSKPMIPASPRLPCAPIQAVTSNSHPRVSTVLTFITIVLPLSELYVNGIIESHHSVLYIWFLFNTETLRYICTLLCVLVCLNCCIVFHWMGISWFLFFPADGHLS